VNNNVISMAKFDDDATKRSPVQCLEEAIKDFDGGVLKNHKKVLVLALNDDDQFSISFLQAGFKMSECLTLCEISKAMFLAQLNYIPMHIDDLL